MKVVLGHKGQVGEAIMILIRDSGAEVTGIEKGRAYSIRGNIEALHCCIPYSKEFQKQLSEYITNLKPDVTIIHSTVLPGTTSRIFNALKKKYKIFYSPIRGQHNRLVDDIRRYRKFIAAPYPLKVMPGMDELTSMSLKTVAISDLKALELTKLLDTTQYGVLIAWAQEAQRYCRELGGDYDMLRDFGKETQNFYNLRPDIHPGHIGGHCVMQNIGLLQMMMKTEMLRIVQKSNELKSKEPK